ncbi:tetratricopeptide (TPR) repeat protein [Virgibacillus natechei]|uniref:Tetratricopeptide (TPR) repeat protein n=1 Tax=Virgibacillus natechei TaxID=1216297 RepID=A0ABS4IIU9_9BACI|nr:tetratricopeptide repeat protein [Virgibacillus natechei]MBP1969909.1 tetratricopeptide (TPR) repeat protein [Virgibacillus natechei]UZD13426.1 tetratricopeptide repeat protein [Virgibacillus natechei]
MITKELREHILSVREKINRHVNGQEYELAREDVQELESILEVNDEIRDDVHFLSLHTMAAFYKRDKNYTKSVHYSKQALHIKGMENEYPGFVIDTFLDYAELEREQKHLPKAMELVNELLDMLKSINWQDMYTYGMAYSSLGKVYLDEKNDDFGVRYLEQALNYFRKSVNKKDLIIGQTTALISDVYIRMKDYNKALSLYQQLLETNQQSEDKVSEGKTLLKIGEIYFYIDAKKARRTITQALKLFEDVYEDKHIDIAKGNLLLGELDETMGGIPRAIKYYKRSLDQMDSFYKENHFLIVYVYSKIGTLSITINEWDQAEHNLEKGLDLSDGFPKMKLQFFHALGKVYSEKELYEQAFSFFQDSLQELAKDGRKQSKGYADTLQDIGFNLRNQDKLEEAYVYFQEALTIHEQLQPGFPEESGMICMRLAYCYENKEDNDLQKAAFYYEKGFKQIEKMPDQEMVQEALAGMIEFFTRMDNPKKKRKYEDKFVKLQRAKSK